MAANAAANDAAAVIIISLGVLVNYGHFNTRANIWQKAGN